MKEKGDVNPTVLTMNIKHHVDGVPLQFNVQDYTNAAGNHYEVTSLHYYLSNFVFSSSEGSTYTDPGVYYIDAADSTTTVVSIAALPKSTYTSVSFVLGLSAAQNISQGLPNNTINNNMEWPDPMGGGYHFMKFEGYFIDSTAQQNGFAIHLGTNVSMVSIELSQLIDAKEDNQTIDLSMNLNEWFVNPVRWDLDSLSYTMGNASAMSAIATNGADVFTFE